MLAIAKPLRNGAQQGLEPVNRKSDALPIAQPPLSVYF